MNSVLRYALAVTCAMAVTMSVTSVHAQAPSAPPAVFARVAGVEISVQSLDLALAQAVRGQFYHGSARDEQLVALRIEVGERLVNEVLLAREAIRRGLVPDRDEVEKRLGSLESRYADRAQWRAKVTEMRPQLTRQFEQDSLVAQLEREVRASAQPTPDEVEAYFRGHPQKFTEPEQFRASIVLLKVDPSSPRTVWDDARTKARALLDQLGAGSDFAEIARTSSTHDSAAKGGDLGYLHSGMIPEPAERALATLAPGEVSEPVTLLEGIAVLRLDERRPARPQAFGDAQRAAAEFARREAAEAAWTALIAALRREQPPVYLLTASAPVPGDALAGAPAK